VVYVIRSEEHQQGVIVNSTSEVPENGAAAEARSEVSNSSQIHQHNFSVSQHNLDAASESYISLRGHQITDQKPPLMKKGKPHRKNVKSLFGETAEHPTNSSRSFVFGENTPEVPQSAELVRRKLKLPWTKKKKKTYMPGEEMSRWRSNFDSWRTSSQMSLDTNMEPVSGTDRGLRRTASQSDLHNIDTVSVGWTDSEVSDTDSVSDSVAEGSVNDKGINVIIL